jgi:membrane-associated phospholipid phosphatase
VVLIGPIWLLDKPVYDLDLHERKIFLLRDIRDATRQFGEPFGIAWIGVVMSFVDRSRRRPLIVAILATLIASGLGSGAKLIVGRERPKVCEGHTIVRGVHWPGTMDPDSSFPSGHTVVAFAFAFGLSRLYRQHRTLWLVLATGCGASRALGGAHFLTDVIVGAWLGWETARLVWDSFIGQQLMSRLDRRIPDAAWLPRWDWGPISLTPAPLPSR